MLNELSGGQLQRVFLARAMAQEPKILLLDEPTNHLDIRNQVELADYLHHWCEDGEHSVIGVMHDINLALRLSRNVLFMQEGRILRQGIFTSVADSEFLNSIYGMDLLGYMREASELWNSVI
jgi:iron complex transport system ATP-binding protein